MSELIFVTSDSCELCTKEFKKVKVFRYFIKLKQVNVEEGYQEYLLRIPVLIKNNKADLMVCGGAEAAICPLGISGFSV